MKNNLLITSTNLTTLSNQEIEAICRSQNCNSILNSTNKSMSADEICRLNQESPLNGILVYYSSDEISRKVFSECSELRVVSRHGVGIDNIDLAAAKEHGVKVVTTTGINDFEGVADLSWALLLDVARKISFSHLRLQHGIWQRTLGINVWRKTLGLIGFGRIGKAVARRAAGFQMSVLVYDPHLNQEDILHKGAQPVSLVQLLGLSDFISLHCPLTEETESLIGEKEFCLMKPTAAIINTARAGLIDQNALIKVLKNKNIWGAGVDVYLKEPVINDPLINSDLPSLVSTPHIGPYTIEIMKEMDYLAITNALDVMKTAIT